MGVGSDIAGSLRLPPMFTGIFGHKPTPRLLSVEGMISTDFKISTIELECCLISNQQHTGHCFLLLVWKNLSNFLTYVGL